ncbi:MAG: helix-turn-helix domain-containing protein [Planctomycetes bacterium]|nr:helix-turn-helix domain-containing protein [Planctomycetota bacterium]
MAVEYMTFQDVLEELQIDEEELKRLVSTAELRGFRAGSSMKFKRDDVMNLKQGRETEPTIILTDSDQEMGIAESSDELILEDSTSDTVINIGDIMGGARSGSQQEIIFDTTEEYSVSPHGEDSDPEAAIPTVEVPSISEDMGLVETDSDAALVEVGSDESMETEAFELMSESEETDGMSEVDDESEEVSAGAASRRRAAGSRRMSQSSRMRALEIEKKQSHVVWTGFLLAVIMFCSLQFGINFSEILGSSPAWIGDASRTLTGITESVWGMFAG